MAGVGRNDPCPCGSGRKHKKCCGAAAGRGAQDAPVRSLPAVILRGLEAHALGDIAAAGRAYREVLARDPGVAEIRRLLDALAADGAPVPARHDLALAFNGLGLVFQDNNALALAEHCYRRALAVVPGIAEAGNNLGNVLKSRGDKAGAIAAYEACLAAHSDYSPALTNLAALLKETGRSDQALAAFERLLAVDPRNATARHAVAALKGTTTDGAPGAYVAELFDSYADRFDSHLVGALKYSAPEQLSQLLAPFLASANSRALDALDLGCGTGLMAERIVPWCRSVTGVDLSSKMLERAAARRIYARLECADLTDFMAGHGAASFDLIVAADVFIYLGNLERTVAEVARLLRPGGLFAFSVEVLDSAAMNAPSPASGFRLNSTGRYAHSPDYLLGLAKAEAMKVETTVGASTRLQDSEPVRSLLSLWRKAPGS